MPFDRRQQGIEQALAQIGQRNAQGNTYSPFQGKIPMQTLSQMGRRPQPMGQQMAMQQAPQQGMPMQQQGMPMGQQQPMPTPGTMPQPGTTQMPPFNQAQQGLQRPAPIQRRRPLTESPLMKNPKFLELLKRRRGLR